MKLKKLNTKGFGHIEVFIFVIAIVAIAGAYLVISHPHAATPTPTATTTNQGVGTVLTPPIKDIHWTKIGTYNFKNEPAITESACVTPSTNGKEIVIGWARMNSNPGITLYTNTEANASSGTGYSFSMSVYDPLTIKVTGSAMTTKWGSYEGPASARVSLYYPVATDKVFMYVNDKTQAQATLKYVLISTLGKC